MSRKEKMTKKNKEGAAFTDDGFAMGKWPRRKSIVNNCRTLFKSIF